MQSRHGQITMDALSRYKKGETSRLSALPENCD
jgi:hypothetical protein